jgi:DNA repair protein RadC
MTKIKDLPTFKRPREKLIEKGVKNLKDEELLAILFRTGKKGRSAIDIAKSFLKKIPKEKLLKTDYTELIEFEEIGSEKACTILASVELVKRALSIKEETLPVIRSAEDVVAQAVYMRDKRREHLMAIYLNARNEMIYKKPMFIGTLNASIVHPREIFALALEKNAASVIIVHNHPSGNREPSEDDIRITKRVAEAGKIMGIELLDHVIITKSNYFSFREKNLM